MGIKHCSQILKYDCRKYSDRSFFSTAIRNREFRHVFRYRVVKELEGKKHLFILYMIARVIYHRSCMKLGCDIPSHVNIGPGWKMIHSWGIVINSKAKIGSDFTILTGAVIGINHTGIPEIGNNVFVGAHALIIGGVHVGDNSIIGAGAIVTHDVPAGAVVCCDAAKIIKNNLEQDSTLNDDARE